MKHKKEMYAIIIASVLTGLVGLIVKLIGTEVHPLTLAFYRIAIGGVFLAIALPTFDPDFHRPKKGDIKLFAVAGLLLAASLSSFVFALSISSVSEVMLITSTYIFFVAIFASMFLKEKLKQKHVLALIFILIGMIIINPIRSGMSIIGLAIALINAMIHAGLLVYMKYEGKRHKSSAVVWILLCASLFLLPMPFIFGFGNVITVLPLLLVLGIVSTAVTYTLLSFGLRKISADSVAILQLSITPITAILLAIVFLQERLSDRTIVGGTFILLGGISLIYSLAKFKSFLHEKLHVI
jgi:drug/metabolite transporter (DMT)-like permease